MLNKQRKIDLPAQTLIGAVLGIAIGLFFGDSCALLRPIGSVYTMLLQAVVYPYLICTLLSGLGKLTTSIAPRLFNKSWVMYLLLLFITFAVLFTLSTTIPITITNQAQGQTQQELTSSLLKLLIPNNIFAALSNNHVPAVVIFCILFGLMLQKTKNTENLFKLLDIISDACIEFWRWLVKFAPFAVCALLAETAGTIRFDQLIDLGAFLIIFFVGTLLLTFWLLPVLLSALIPVTYKEILSKLQTALILAATTTLSVVALPYIRDFTYALLAKLTRKEQYPDDIVNTMVSISYPFGQIGNFFIYLFIIFSAIYFGHSINQTQYYLLPLITFLSSIGSPSTTVNTATFLASWLHIPPSDTTNLYISLTPLLRYGQVLASVMGIAFLTIVTTFAYYGALKVKLKKIIIHLLAAGICLGIFIHIFNRFDFNPASAIYQRINTFPLPTTVTHGIAVTMEPNQDALTKINTSTEDALFRIQKTGVMRVGYNADMPPFTFFNNSNQLVGYDVAYMYELARALNAKIEFIPFAWQNVVNDIVSNKFDIAIGGIYVTSERLQKVAFTKPYFRSPVSFIIPKDWLSKFSSAEQIRAIPNLKIAVFNDPILIPLAQQNFPNAKLVILPKYDNQLGQAFATGTIDVAMWSQAQTKIWALGHPDYISVTPTHIAANFLMGYMIDSNSVQFLNFLNYWLELKTNDGFADSNYKQWFLAAPPKDAQPRWSILHNVLHWN